MKKIVIVLVLSAFFMLGTAAPTDLEVSLKELLAETAGENVKVAESEDLGQKTASIEQGTFKELLRSLFNTSLNYLRNRFINPGALEQVMLQSLLEKEAEIEQENLRELTRRILALLTNYAQSKLNPLQDREVAEIEQRNIRELASQILTLLNNYAQSKLGPNRLLQNREMAEIEQKNLRELASRILTLLNNYAQSKLSPNTQSFVARKGKAQAEEEVNAQDDEVIEDEVVDQKYVRRGPILGGPSEEKMAIEESFLQKIGPLILRGILNKMMKG